MMLEEQRVAVAAAGRRLAKSGLCPGGSGNVSLRYGDVVVITGRGGRLRALGPEDCVVVDTAGKVIDGVRAASSETGMHRALYASSDVGAVVHTHGRFCVVESTLVERIDGIHYAVAAFGGPIRVAPYATFGTDELAQHVVNAMAGRRGALLRNHGAVTAAADLDEAVELAEALEWLASVNYLARADDGDPAVLSAEELRAVSRRRRW